MGRRKHDARMDSLERIYQAMQNPSFSEYMDRLKAQVNKYSEPILPIEDKKIAWDKNQGCFVYRGLYYDLRDICDLLNLDWPEDGIFLWQLAYAKTEDEAKTVLSLDNLPLDHHWQWFRMAESGMGLPKEEEIIEARKLMKDFTSSGKKRNFQKGFTLEEIAELCNKEERAVRGAVKSCKEFIERNGRSQYIASLIGLDGPYAFLWWATDFVGNPELKEKQEK